MTFMTFQMTLNLKFEDVIRPDHLEYTSVDQKKTHIFVALTSNASQTFLQAFCSFGWSTTSSMHE